MYGGEDFSDGFFLKNKKDSCFSTKVLLCFDYPDDWSVWLGVD
jgi:hypothetical protein